MIKLRISLNQTVYNALRSFGDLNSVINRIIDEDTSGTIYIPDTDFNYPGSSVRIYVTITNKFYIYKYMNNELPCTLSKLLSNFVMNEIYNDIDWSTLPKKSSTTRKINSLLKIDSELTKYSKYTMTTSERKDFQSLCEIFDRLKRYNNV